VKILSIRIRNLASISGDYTVDFDAEPLRGAGLFAITGPTGAGKSTLLDALCLALFDATPRLDSRGGPAIGHTDDVERLLANDVRSLVSRGASNALAQVEFVGRDGHRWRASWSVARAHGQAAGKLQKQVLSLHDLTTDQAAGGTKTETLEAIEDKLGLTFDQFRKSVLLAQGDFADFLKAGADERSLLLQRLTGAEIYERISIAAHRKAREARDRAKELESRRAGVTVLPADERAALEVGIVEAAEVLGGRAARLKALEALAREAKAAGELDREAARLSLARESAVKEGSSAGARKEKGAADVVSAAELLDMMKADQEAGRPEVEKARELDVRVAGADKAFGEAKAVAAEAKGKLDAARNLLGGRKKAEEGLRDALGSLERWLEENGASKEVAARWEQLDAGLEELVRIAGERALSVKGHAEAVKAIESAAGKASALDAALLEARQKVAEAAEGRRQQEERLGRIPVASFRERLEALAALEKGLGDLGGIRERAVAVEAARLLALRTAGEAEEKARVAREMETLTVARLGELAILLPEAKRALSLAESSLGLEERRTNLVEGEPCPLCGAKEHPWAVEGAPVPAAVELQRRRVEELEAEEKREVAKQNTSAARARSESDIARIEKGRAGEMGAEGASLATRWTAAVAGLAALDSAATRSLPSGPLDESAGPELASRTAAVRDETLTARAAVKEAEAIEKALKELGRQAETLASAVEACRVEKEQADQAARDAEKKRDTRQAAIRSHDAAADREFRLLQPALAGRPELAKAVADGPGAVRSELSTEATAYREKSSAAEKYRTELSAAEKETASALSAVAPRDEQAEAARREAASKQEAFGSLQAERRALLEGKSVEEVEEKGRKLIAHCEWMLGDARKRAGDAETAFAAAKAKAEAAEARAVEVKTQAAEAMERLQADRLKAGLPAEVAVDAALAEAEGALTAAQEAANARQAAKLGDDAARVKLAGLEKEIDEHARASRVWLQMDDLVGSQDGKKFRIFVQSLTLEALVQAANHHLKELARRYRLERVPGTDMDLQIVDSILGDERRSVQSLSGGETFLVSLGLALGLSSLATQRTRVETLFVDEGFGTLDADTLDKALSALEALQASGRRVGIISHVAALTDRIATRVVVAPKGVGRSTISVVGLS
jgi:exonuclease SbcC